jgi:hypothetical protein
MKMYETVVGYGMEGISQAGRSLAAAKMLARRNGGSAESMIKRFETLAKRRATPQERAKIQQATNKRINAERAAKRAKELEYQKAKKALEALGKQLNGKKVTLKDLEAC